MFQGENTKCCGDRTKNEGTELEMMQKQNAKHCPTHPDLIVTDLRCKLKCCISKGIFHHFFIHTNSELFSFTELLRNHLA